jgi:hypothetical protein
MANLLQKYEETFPEIIKSGLSDQEKLVIIWRWFELKAFDARLNNSMTLINAEKQEVQQKQQKQSFIGMLQSLGYVGNNCVEDYKKLFNRPEIFGSTWEEKAELFHAQSTSIDDFINLAIQYL